MRPSLRCGREEATLRKSVCFDELSNDVRDVRRDEECKRKRAREAVID